MVESFPDMAEALCSFSNTEKKSNKKGRIKVPSATCMYVGSNERQRSDCFDAH